MPLGLGVHHLRWTYKTQSAGAQGCSSLASSWQFPKSSTCWFPWFADQQCCLPSLLPWCSAFPSVNKMACYSTLPDFSTENLISNISASALAKTLQPFPGILLKEKYTAWHILNKSRQPFIWGSLTSEGKFWNLAEVTFVAETCLSPLKPT